MNMKRNMNKLDAYDHIGALIDGKIPFGVTYEPDGTVTITTTENSDSRDVDHVKQLPPNS